MLGTMGTGSGPLVGLNANHAKSKVTSLIRRKASEGLDEEDERDLQYSESPNATTHYFQLEATTAGGNGGTHPAGGVGKKALRNVSSVVPEEEAAAGSRLNTSQNQPVNSYINDINQECSQLITNLNFTKGPEAAAVVGGGESSFERESQGSSSVVNQKRSIESMDNAVKQGSSNKKESLNASKSANLHKDHPKLPPPIQKKSK